MTILKASAQRAGVLPSAGAVNVGGVRLPSGRLIRPDPSMNRGGLAGEPVLWVTDVPVGGWRRFFGGSLGSLWRKLAIAFPQTGLWPLALEGLNGDEDRPWLAGELDPAACSAPEGHEVAQVLAAAWDGAAGGDQHDEEAEEAAREELAPYGRKFPGLAAGATLVARMAPELALLTVWGRLGLVAVTRPADALAKLGWLGPANHLSDVGVLSAVLRSWEDRFGAHLVGVGFDTLTLAVQRPPTTHEAALAVAAEHYAICPDNISQGIGSIELYARGLRAQPVWTFWWD